MDLHEARARTAWLEDAFFVRLSEIAARRKLRPANMLALMIVESGVRPSALNPLSGARGIFQAIPQTLKGLGWPHPLEAFTKLSATGQLTWYDRYLSGVGSRGIDSAARLFWYNLFPHTMTRGSSPDTIVMARDATDKRERAGYKWNAAVLDKNKDGKITFAELTQHIKTHATDTALYHALLVRLQYARGSAATLPTALASPVSAGMDPAAALFLASACVGLGWLFVAKPSSPRRRSLSHA